MRADLRAMFLLHPTIFPWDLAILALIAFFGAGTLLCLFWRRRHPRAHVLSRLCVGSLGILSLLGMLAIVYGSFVEPRLLVVTERTVRFPSIHPLKIAVISDLHVGPYKDSAFVRRVVQKTNMLFPDLVLLAGDFLFDGESEMTELEPLKDLRASLGVFAVAGNHDGGRYLTLARRPYAGTDRTTELAVYLRTLGIRVLENEREVVQLPDQEIAVAGIDDIWSPGSSLDDALRNLPDGMPTILLAHNPDVVLDTLSQKAHLIVAGHTHGGQIRLPLLGPVPPLPTKLGEKYDQGLFAIDDTTTLAITRGAGETLARARLFAWPEILLLTTTVR